MFCTSVDGAEALTTMYTISETAIINGVNTFYYYKYLLEKTPKIVTGDIEQQLENLMPWSEKYKQYEAQQLHEHIHQYLPPSEECPVATKSLLISPRFIA